MPLHLDDGEYHCFDGLIPIQRTKKSYLEFRFPRRYGLQPREVVPFVGSYTSTIDYTVESELKRASVVKEVIAGILTIRMIIESPLLRHLYGIVWNPKPRRNT